MSISKINSYAKINLSLKILGKNKLNLHKIESIISFVDLNDEIFIKKIKKNKHIVNFYGKFSFNIPKNNTVTNLLKYLDYQNYLNNQKFHIRIKKNIPLKSGLGGGSMNASSLFNYFVNKNIIKLKSNTINDIYRKIGSDFILGVYKKKSIFKKDGNLYFFRKKKIIHLLIVKPKFGCSTKEIYAGVQSFSKAKLKMIKKNNISISFIKNLQNDLEKIALKKYPKLKNLKKIMLNLPNVLFVRMTGSGSSFVAYFPSRKTSLNAAKIFKRKYKNYLCIKSKTI